MTPGFAGAITNLAAGSTEPSSMTGSLGTAAAGSVNGGITVHQNSNDTISGLLNTALPDHTPAVANVLTTAPMDFRIVHVCDPARTRSVTVQNGAAVTALNDEPVGSTSAGGAPSGQRHHHRPPQPAWM